MLLLNTINESEGINPIGGGLLLLTLWQLTSGQQIVPTPFPAPRPKPVEEPVGAPGVTIVLDRKPKDTLEKRRRAIIKRDDEEIILIIHTFLLCQN